MSEADMRPRAKERDADLREEIARLHAKLDVAEARPGMSKIAASLAHMTEIDWDNFRYMQREMREIIAHFEVAYGGRAPDVGENFAAYVARMVRLVRSAVPQAIKSKADAGDSCPDCGGYREYTPICSHCDVVYPRQAQEGAKRA